MEVIPEAAVEAARVALEFHLTDSMQESGCALRCGYDGDDMAAHLAEHILEAAAPHMLREAWDDGHSEGVDYAEGMGRGSNPYEVSK